MITTNSKAITGRYIDEEELSKYLKIKKQIDKIINSQIVLEGFFDMEELSNCLTIKEQIELYFVEDMSEEDALVRIRKFVDKNNNFFYVANWLKDDECELVERYNDKDIFIQLTDEEAETVDNLIKESIE